MAEDEGSGLHIWEKISLDLGEINRRGKRREAAWIQRATDTNRDFYKASNGIASGSAAFSFSLDAHPQQGRVYIVRKIAVGPPLVTSAAPTVSGCYIFQSPVDPIASGAVDMAHLVDTLGTTLPVVRFYSSRYIVLRNPDKLWCVITGASANQQFVSSVQIEDYQDGGYGAEIEL